MRIGVGGKVGPLRGGISNRGIGGGVGPFSVGTSTRRRRRSTGSGDASGVVLLIGLALGLFAVTWPYFVFQSATHSALAGWIAEAVYLPLLLLVVVFAVRASRRRSRSVSEQSLSIADLRNSLAASSPPDVHIFAVRVAPSGTWFWSRRYRQEEWARLYDVTDQVAQATQRLYTACQGSGSGPDIVITLARMLGGAPTQVYDIGNRDEALAVRALALPDR